MRWLFVDGFNSVSHVVFGSLSVINPLIAPFFIAYQLIFLSGWNTIIDLLEFVIGYEILALFMRSSSLGRALCRPSLQSHNESSETNRSSCEFRDCSKDSYTW